MARALQCPDCGHREPIDNVIDVDEFRCRGCGRALKVPPQVKPVGVGAGSPAAPGAAPVGATPDTMLDPRVPSTAPEVGDLRAPDTDSIADASTDRDAATTRVLARAQADETAPPPDLVPPSPARGRRAAAPAQAVVLPRVLRLVIWAVMLPVGLGGTFYVALRTDWLSRDDLLGTIGEADWSRFVPIAWLMPVAAIVVALLVHCTIIVLEQIVARRRHRRAVIGSRSATSPEAA